MVGTPALGGNQVSVACDVAMCLVLTGANARLSLWFRTFRHLWRRMNSNKQPLVGKCGLVGVPGGTLLLICYHSRI